jgi:hypothetical protein
MTGQPPIRLRPRQCFSRPRTALRTALPTRDWPTRNGVCQPGVLVIGTAFVNCCFGAIARRAMPDQHKIRPFYCCTVCIAVIDAAKIDQFWSTYALSQRYIMSTLDEITKEKQRVGEALARIDAQRERQVSKLRELEAAERVLARYTKGRQGKKTSSVKMPAKVTTAIPAGARRGSSNLNDRVLALATGKTQREITAACKGARPNHVGAPIARHKRAGRIEERDEKLYAIRATGTEQHAVV